MSVGCVKYINAVKRLAGSAAQGQAKFVASLFQIVA
jgi:hypothetical protein